MKTIFLVFRNTDDYCIQYAILDGDYSHLNGVFIDPGCDQGAKDELFNLLFEEVHRGVRDKVPFLSEFPKQYLLDNPETIVISCGNLLG